MTRSAAALSIRRPGNVRRVVTARTQYSLTNARDHSTEHLCVGDAERLGLAGNVQAEEVLRLCENQHPSTDQTLTQRLKGTRTEQGQVTANRRIFYDFTFSPPKSVSLVAFLGNDERILAAHTRAVRSALSEFEASSGIRIRVGGAQHDRSTGNFAAPPVHPRHVACS
jgi:conjugative relaxase-like TrwC/TraI family protein